MTKDALLAKLQGVIDSIRSGELNVVGEGRMTDTGVTVQSGWTIGKDAITFPRCEMSERERFLQDLLAEFPGLPVEIDKVRSHNFDDYLSYDLPWGTFTKEACGTHYIESSIGGLEVGGESWGECKKQLRTILDPLVRYIKGDSA